MIGEFVSGNNNAAMTKAAPEIIKVVQAIHRQLAQSTIHPLAMGATMGPAMV